MTGRKGTHNDLAKMLQELMNSYQQMILITDQINSITQKTNLLSLNSSIEAARVGNAGKGFAVIAKQIQLMAQQSKEANVNSARYMDDMKTRIGDVAGVRTADIAFDMIDKIDRNLFERNCDVQAWATFQIIIDYLQNPTEDGQHEVTTLLHDICELYEVYHDIILADSNGYVVSNACNHELIGEYVKTTTWFTDVYESGKNKVSDMYFSKTNGYTVAYSAPVKNRAGTVIGVLSTRFNWDYIYDIIDKAKISPNGHIYLVNLEGTVIASKNRDDIFKKTYRESELFLSMLGGESYGYQLLENKQQNKNKITGFAHTKGYNSYQGKGWSVIVEEEF